MLLVVTDISNSEGMVPENLFNNSESASLSGSFLSWFHGSLNHLECILGLWVLIFIRMELFGQFSVELGQLSRLHLSHPCHNHLLWRVQELVDQKSLVFIYWWCRIITILHLILHKLLRKSICGLIDALFHDLSPLRLIHKKRLLIATKTRICHLTFHI